VANSYTTPLEKDFKIDANGARAFMGHFLCVVEAVKRFAKVHLHRNVSNLKKISKISTLPQPGKISADSYAQFAKLVCIL